MDVGISGGNWGRCAFASLSVAEVDSVECSLRCLGNRVERFCAIPPKYLEGPIVRDVADNAGLSCPIHDYGVKVDDHCAMCCLRSVSCGSTRIKNTVND